ncbi:MAG: hypothetical protein ABR611_03270 [Chthoniobacterales bacterium]
MSPKISRLVLSLLVMCVVAARGQQAVSSITQSRLFTNQTAPGTSAVDANGTALPEEEATSDSGDDSFGAQIILKNQERPRKFSVFSDISISRTNNVDLTPRATRSDSFLAARMGGAWKPLPTSQFIGEISVSSSLFRYDRARALDFETIGGGAGLSWLVPRGAGIILFGRYDFTEVLDASSNELLQDHAFTFGAQKIFVFGRSHFLSAGINGSLGLSTPRSQQRDQAAMQAAYHLQITRSLDLDFAYRYAAQFYNEGDRLDHNQTLSLAMGFSPNRWLRLTASISVARNDSNEAAFEYDVFNLGSGLGASVSF